MIVIKPFELSLLAAIALAVMEVLSGTFIFLGFSLGCLAAAGAEALTGTFVIGRDTLVFAAVSLLAIAALRMSFGRAGDSKRADGDVNDY